jgi:hypothetical protein
LAHFATKRRNNAAISRHHSKNISVPSQFLDFAIA